MQRLEFSIMHLHLEQVKVMCTEKWMQINNFIDFLIFKGQNEEIHCLMKTHELEYDLEILSRTASTKDVDSLQCTQKRKVTENIKYFTRSFRVDNCKS